MTFLRAACLASLSVLGTSCGEPERQAGAWFGNIKLCAGNVENYRRSIDRPTQLPVLRVAFRKNVARQLEEMSRDFVGKPIALRVNGEELVAPTLIEPLTEGKVELLGLEPDRLVDVIAYMDRPC
uniref:hypothetical protein n=1 Tax=Parerythrobacter lutipelagi TaxID=1964208 RepID=UPI0010F53261|nr:hypothetical protein [Parerythrobacter lutipelagi]